MKPVKFPEMTQELGSPVGWSDVKPLPIWTDGHQVLSSWRPTWRERISILFFAQVWLLVKSGHTQPPVALWATRKGYKAEKLK